MEEEGASHPSLEPADGGGADLISALPEDVLLHVLRRLGCARAAARTSVLSRPWRGLWTRLPDLIFRDVPVRSIQSVLSPSSHPGAVQPGVSLLDITFTSLEAAAGSVPLPTPELREKLAVVDVPSLLRAAAWLSPVEFHLALPACEEGAEAGLPCFRRTTSIQVHAQNLRLTMPRYSGAYPRLEKLTLWGCSVDVAALVLRCPCLRVLRVNEAPLDAGVINIHSDSLQKLSLRTKRPKSGIYSTIQQKKSCIRTDRINVEAPMLEQLAVSISTGTNVDVSIVAPLLEKLSWECSYDARIAGFPFWGLSKVRLYAAESQRVVTCLQPSNVYVLSLQMSCDWFGAELNLVQQIEKHLITDFSILDLKMEYAKESMVHVFGPLVLHLLGMHRIRTAMRRFQIHFARPKAKARRCSGNCHCDEPKNWRSKDISLINLEEVEIDGFNGENHEFDFLQVIFRCAPMLKRMAVRTSYDVRKSNHHGTKIQDIFKAYPFVECKLIQR